MQADFKCFEKTLTRTDVNRNLEIPNGAHFMPAGNGVMLVTDQAGNRYQFIASERRGGRRSMTDQWRAFAEANHLQVGDALRIYHSGNGDDEYVVEMGVKLFGTIIAWRPI
ncbi:unnamed protein product [Ilex paraguariensis]|uniref:TF-B3 domain-containing protein n=1 Tax=Ilex paraguariensis TaxID=185542 RepID=A0ABC8SIZ0_9AQUA